MTLFRRTAGRLLLAVLPLAFPAAVRAQSVADLIRSLGIDRLAHDYLRPAADAVGTNFNTGLYHSARVDSGFHIWIGGRLVWTLIPQSERSFVAKIPPAFTQLGYPAEISTATVVGGTGAVLHSTQTDPGTGQPYPDITLPDGIDAANVALVLPQVEIGAVLGTRLMVRGFPPTTIDRSLGRISFIGIGLTHSPTAYIRLPFDLAFMGSVQQFTLGSVLTVTNYNANVHVSLPSEVLSPYAGVGYEGYLIDVSYTYTPANAGMPGTLNQPATIELHFARPNFRFTVGANLTLFPLVNFTADYNFGVQDTFSLGAGITL